MKKLALLMAVAFALCAIAPAFAQLEWEDPVLCVNGKWLLIDSANPLAVEVIVPKGAAYGDRAAGGCAIHAPAPLLPLSQVKERGHDEGVRVRIDGRGASPVVTVSYGDESHTERNHGGVLRFRFK